MSVELLKDLDRDDGWTLMVGGAEQSYVDVGDPTHLEFEYMQHIALAVDAVFPGDRPLRAVHLGGGALTLPRWLAATRPGSEQVVVEASAEVLEVVRPLGPVPGCRTVVGDALEGLAALPLEVADLLVWDLYDGPRAVTGALDLAAVAGMRSRVRPGGLAVLNVSDVAPFAVVRPVLAALLVTFDDVAVLAEPPTLRGRRSGNCVLLGGRAPLPVTELRRVGAAAPARARVVCGPDLADLVGDAVPATPEHPLPDPDESSGRAFL